MPRSQSTTLTLPPFAGATRRLVLLNVAVFFGLALMRWVTPIWLELFLAHLILVPAAVLRGEIWQLATYSVVETSVLGLLFGMLTLWFAGSLLEGSFSSRWVLELYWTSVIGGAVLATVLAFTHVFGLRTDVPGMGAWAGVFGLLVAIAMKFGDQEFTLWVRAAPEGEVHGGDLPAAGAGDAAERGQCAFRAAGVDGCAERLPVCAVCAADGVGGRDGQALGRPAAGYGAGEAAAGRRASLRSTCGSRIAR